MPIDFGLCTGEACLNGVALKSLNTLPGLARGRGRSPCLPLFPQWMLLVPGQARGPAPTSESLCDTIEACLAPTFCILYCCWSIGMWEMVCQESPRLRPHTRLLIL